MPDIAEWSLACALAERDATAAKNALDAHSEDPIDFGLEVFLSRSFVEGLIALHDRKTKAKHGQLLSLHARSRRKPWKPNLIIAGNWACLV